MQQPTIAEVLDRNQDTDFFNPWRKRIAPDRRISTWIALAARLGVRYASCSFESWDVSRTQQAATQAQMTRVRDDLREWVRRFGTDPPNEDRGGLILYGRPGTGKDHLMVAGISELIVTHGIDCDWIDGLELFARFRKGISDGGDISKVIEKLVRPMVLAISDPVPPKGSTTEFATEMLQRVIDRRYRMGRSTWMTMNVKNAAEAEERLATPLVSRMKHGSLCIACDWDDYREPVKRPKATP